MEFLPILGLKGAPLSFAQRPAQLMIMHKCKRLNGWSTVGNLTFSIIGLWVVKLQRVK